MLRFAQHDGSERLTMPLARNKEYAGVDWLVQQLPPQRKWADAERARWMKALTSAVDWVVTVVEDEPPSTAGEAAAGNNGEASGPLAERTTPDASEGVTREV